MLYTLGVGGGVVATAAEPGAPPASLDFGGHLFDDMLGPKRDKSRFLPELVSFLTGCILFHSASFEHFLQRIIKLHTYTSSFTYLPHTCSF